MASIFWRKALFGSMQLSVVIGRVALRPPEKKGRKSCSWQPPSTISKTRRSPNASPNLVGAAYVVCWLAADVGRRIAARAVVDVGNPADRDQAARHGGKNTPRPPWSTPVTPASSPISASPAACQATSSSATSAREPKTQRSAIAAPRVGLRAVAELLPGAPRHYRDVQLCVCRSPAVISMLSGRPKSSSLADPASRGSAGQLGVRTQLRLDCVYR